MPAGSVPRHSERVRRHRSRGMIDLRRIRYVRIGTPDLGEATNFATKVLGLEPAGRERGMAYFRSDERDHTICYVEGDPAKHSIAFEVSESADLQAMAAEIERAGYPVHAGYGGPNVKRAACWISSPSKIRPGTRSRSCGAPRPPRAATSPRAMAGITGFSHIGLHTGDARAMRVLDARVQRAPERLDRRCAAAAHQRRPSYDRALSEFARRRAAHQPPG